MTYKYFFVWYFLILLFNCSPKKQNQLTEEKEVVSNIKEDDTSSLEEFERLIAEYDSEDRDEWQHPEIIIKSIGNLKGKTVADIGAGTGYFSFKLAKTADTVYAVDIDKRFLDYIEERKEGLLYGLGQNVLTKLTTPDNPGLYPSKLDVVLLVNTYSYINHRVEYFRKVRDVLKSDGYLYIVDFKERNVPVGPPSNIRVNYKAAASELKRSGFKTFEVDSTSLPYQYILKAS